MKKLILLLACISFGTLLFGQTEYKLTKSRVQISGTSTLHDWTADVTRYEGHATLTIANGALTGIQNITVNLDARSIKSEKGATMDKNMYKALQTDKYPTITFSVTRVTPVSGVSVAVEGKLTIAGTTKTINVTASRSRNSSGEWVFSGTKALKMTDFNVEPPVLLLGTLKTGNDVTITFEATFAPTAELSLNQK